MSIIDIFNNLHGSRAARWGRFQTGLGAVCRWKKYTRCLTQLVGLEAARQQIIEQNDLEHVISIERLAEDFLLSARQWNQAQPPCDQFLVDEALILRALRYHDDGEVSVGDTDEAQKNGETDGIEYQAFLASYAAMPPATFQPIREAYLLQYVLKPPTVLRQFLSDGDFALVELWRADEQKKLEAVFFRLVEVLDYVLHGLRLYRERDNVHFLTWILRLKHAELCQLALYHSSFHQVIWTGKMMEAARAFLSEHAEIPSEHRVWEGICRIDELDRARVEEERRMVHLPLELRDPRRTKL